jgi:hypothetical protein
MEYSDSKLRLYLSKLRWRIGGLNPSPDSRLGGLVIDPAECKINGQRVLRRGEGSRGIVYEIHDSVLDRPVALKLDKEWLDGRVSEPFGGEKLISKAFSGEPWPAALALVYEADPEGRIVFSELHRNGDLQNLETGGRETLEENLTSVLLGMDKIHGKRLAHRDIKPENFLVADDGRLLFTDFDFAAECEDDGRQRGDEKIARGTPIYAAPELILEDEPNLRSCDCWSLGMAICNKILGRGTCLLREFLRNIYHVDCSKKSDSWQMNKFARNVIKNGEEWKRFLQTKFEKVIPPLGPLLQESLVALLNPDRKNALGAREILEYLEREGSKAENREEYAKLNKRKNEQAGVTKPVAEEPGKALEKLKNSTEELAAGLAAISLENAGGKAPSGNITTTGGGI